jgi:transglutaminase-like putative cysteine protease
MRFQITHLTQYRYADPASESYMEARIAPPSTTGQTVLRRTLAITPDCRVTSYRDYFGNTVEQFSVIARHTELLLRAESEVETHPVIVSPEALDISISEARQIYRGQLLARYDYLRPSAGVQLGRTVFEHANRLFRSSTQLGETVHALLHWVHEHFTYQSGVTHVGTTVDEALTLRRGVCQDFAHVMIAILRSAEIPARYVCGYIETDRQRDAVAAAPAGERPLVGAAESHAWVEVGLPNGDWYALDPTNDIPAGERHVMVSAGRDFHDVSPTRGVFKGAGGHALSVSVVMQRQSNGAIQ